MRRFGWKLFVFAAAASVCATHAPVALAAQIWLKDGRILEGKVSPVGGLVDVPKGLSPDGAMPLHLIAMVDDDLRRTFVSRRQIQKYVPEDSTEIFEKFRIPNPAIHAGPTVQSVGPFKAEPFDDQGFGRRIVRMTTNRGPVNVIQCITEITPLWTKLEGRTHVWDMRISTSAIPPADLARILARQTEQDDVEQRIKVARFYVQSERYELASETLQRILADFPNDDALRQRLEPTVQAIRQRSARRLLDELKLRRNAGQHELVQERLKGFPSEGVAGNILEEVRQLVAEYESLESERQELIEKFDELLGQVQDEGLRQRIEPIRREIAAELNVNNIGRLGAFRLMLDDQSRLPEEKLSLAISGWLLGADSALLKLPVALSVYDVRGLVHQYFNAPDALSRARVLEQFYGQEGGTPALVAKLLAHMKPPVDTPPPGADLELLPEEAVPEEAQPEEPATTKLEARAEPPPVPPWIRELAAPGDAADPQPADAGEPPLAEQPVPPPPARPGYYELEVPGPGNAPPVKYLVQLPPEYDPYRRYPAIVTLHGAGSTPALQVTWWAGDWTPGGWRNGQATRHGYVVIAPAWAVEHQNTYQYSAREHAAVLDCLRDACRRFAVDTDRVFLSGHSMGGDAAWDIGLAHPDLWAGVIPIVAQSDKYCALYWENAERVPFYFVAGELDGAKMVNNARDLDRYLKRGYNVTVVEYRGRGHEHFSDEIQRLFGWMERFRRDFYPEEFSAYTMRYWDNFFWWVELEALPARAIVDPADWPPPRGTQPMQTRASITRTNGLRIRTGADTVRVWLSPEMLNLQERVSIEVNGRAVVPRSEFLEPDLETLLEDTRTRGDRQHPFWIKVESGRGTTSSARR